MHCYVFAQPWEIPCCVLVVAAYLFGARVLDYLRWRASLQLQERIPGTAIAAARVGGSTGGAQAKRRPARPRRRRPVLGGTDVIEQRDPRQLYDDTE